jgi:3-oxoadipate enol-lactonase
MTSQRTGRTSRGLNYMVQGDGPALLWLSGYAVPASALDELVEALSERFTCITFDHRGSGRTRPSLTPLTTARMSRDAVDVLKSAGFASAHVVGISLGGMVAQELALRAPHRVRGLILVATSAGGPEAFPASMWTIVSALASAPDRVPGARHVNARGAWTQAWAAVTHDASTRLDQVQAPTLVLHGERDPFLPAENAEALARLVPGSRLHVFPGAGHLFPYEEVESTTKVIQDWLDLVGEVATGVRRNRSRCPHWLSAALQRPARSGRIARSAIRHLSRSLLPRS